MLRSSFFSIGVFVALWGIVFLYVDQLILEGKSSSKKSSAGYFTSVNDKRQLVFNPPEWASFSLMSVGAVTMLYAAALPRQQMQ